MRRSPTPKPCSSTCTRSASPEPNPPPFWSPSDDNAHCPSLRPHARPATSPLDFLGLDGLRRLLPDRRTPTASGGPLALAADPDLARLSAAPLVCPRRPRRP